MSKDLHHNKKNAIRFVHITDTHLLDQSEDTFHGLNTKKNLEKVLFNSQKYYSDIDFFLFTGDISQTGTKQSYALFKSVIREYDLPIYCVPGNHDMPALLQEVVPACPNNSINVVQLGAFSLILLSSWVAGENHGMITQQCLQQLDDYLRNNKNQFNIIAIHHPPVLINSKWLDELSLKNQAEFLQIINRYSRDILLVCGHVHQGIDQQLGNLRLLATPSTCHQYKKNAEHMQRVDMPLPAYRFVTLSSDNTLYTEIHYLE